MRESYGIDAPTIVRNLALVGGTCLGLAITSRFVGVRFLQDLEPVLQGSGIGMLIGAGWMMVSSLWLKKVVRDRLLGSRKWRGDEQALDLGCGRGLVAIAIARRLGSGGKVRGLDLWQAADLSDNSPERALANAAAANVRDKVIIDTGDMRDLPYADGEFDVVASMTAIHNVPGRGGREKAVEEIWRVTKAGGEILIFDIRHARAYAAQLQALGAAVNMRGPILLWGPLGWRFSAIKPA